MKDLDVQKILSQRPPFSAAACSRTLEEDLLHLEGRGQGSG